MRVVEPSYEIESIDGTAILRNIEKAGRVCYKSEDRITDESAPKFIAGILKRGHESVIEHEKVTVRIICDRGVSHEIVRHRIGSYSQESTRYVSSSKKKKPIVESEDSVVEEYLNGFSMRKLSEYSSGRFSEWEVFQILNKRQVPRRSLGNSGWINDDYFDEIDTVEKAYLFGLILADGNIRKEGNQITITQHKNHSWYVKYMIETFIQQVVGYSMDKNCYTISFSNKKLKLALIKKGIKPRKSFDMTDDDAVLIWRAIPLDLKHSFLRGFLDGDGSVRFFEQSNLGKTKSCQMSWCGHRFLLNQIKLFITDRYGYDCGLALVSGTNKLYRLTVTKPIVAKEIILNMLEGFVFPFGNPNKTQRMFDAVGHKKLNIYSEVNSKFIVIQPVWLSADVPSWIWYKSMLESEESYAELIYLGWGPQQARSVLPNSLKTEIVVTYNLREWRHFFKLRTAPAAHPQMREITIPMLKEFKEKLPVIFDDIKLN